MKKLLKILAILIAVTVALLIAVVVLLPLIVDPNQYKDDIVKAVKTSTGRDLKIGAPIGLSVFPRLGLDVGGLELSNAEGFGAEPMAQVDKVLVQVQLWPLLRRQLVVDAVRVSGLQLNLQKSAQGRTNWDDLGGGEKTATTPDAPGSSATALANLRVALIEVRQTQVTWDDRQAGARYAVRNLELTVGDVLGSKPADLQLAFDLDTGTPKAAHRAALTARLRLDLDGQALELERLDIGLGDIKLHAALTATKILEAPNVRGRIEIAPFNARVLMQQWGATYVPADAKALIQVALAANFEHTPTATTLSDLKLTLDDSQVSGRIAVTNPAAAYQLELAIDAIDLDRYLPPAGPPAANAPVATPASAPVVVPLAPLRELNATGKLRIRNLKAMGLKSTDVAIQVAARGGRISLGPNSAKLYNGTYAGRTLLDVTGAMPKLQFEEKLSQVALGPLLKDAGVFAHFSGTGNVDLKLTAQGAEAAQITRTLSGTTAVQLRDGKITGVNLRQTIDDARAKMKALSGKTVATKPRATDETAFESLSAILTITNGVARNDDFRLIGPTVRAEGRGTVDLVKEALDYRLNMTLAKDADSKGTTAPLHISGPFTDLSYLPDVGAVLKEQTDKAVEKQVDKWRKKLLR